MKKNILNLFKKGRKTANEKRKGEATVNTEFVKSISFEEDPFADEVPAYTKMYDLEGNEVEQ